MLETSTNPLFLRHDLICVFTAVPSIVIGLECTEHTCYDIILINHDWENTNAIEFVRILRNLGVQTPLIMVHSDLCPQCMHEYHAIFCSFLQKPFSANARLLISTASSKRRRLALNEERITFGLLEFEQS